MPNIPPNSWKPITSQDVLAEITPIESALISNQLGTTANTSVAKILAEVINGVRDQILAGGNSIDQPGLIPDQLRHDVISLARWEWIISLPKLQTMQTPERKAAAESATKRFQAIASRDPNREKTVLPQNPMATQAPVNAVGIIRPGKHIQDFGRLGST